MQKTDLYFKSNPCVQSRAKN